MRKYIITEELRDHILYDRDINQLSIGAADGLSRAEEYNPNKPQKDISYHTKRSADALEEISTRLPSHAPRDFSTLLANINVEPLTEDRVREIVTEMLNK